MFLMILVEGFGNIKLGAHLRFLAELKVPKDDPFSCSLVKNLWEPRLVFLVCGLYISLSSLLLGLTKWPMQQHWTCL